MTVNTITRYNSFWIIVLALLLATATSVNAKEGATEKAGDILQIIIPAGAYGAVYYLNDNEGRTEFYKSFFVNLGVTFALKFAVNRQRPDLSDNSSFPSGHTSMAFQGATFIHKRYGWKYSVPAYAGAAFVGYSRVLANKHYVEDVIAGAALGILSSYYFTTPYKNIDVTPVAGHGFYGLSVGGRW